jgi:hypothetical protein
MFSNLPIYFSLFHLPADIARRLEHIQRDFLWDGFGCEPKLHLVNWKTDCSPVPRGGLVVKNFMLFIKTLLGKWLCDSLKKRTPYGDK